MAWDIEYFQRADGTAPALEFENNIAKQMMGKLNSWADSIAESEGTIGGGRFKKCHDLADLWEIRVRVGKDLGRELCTRDGNRLVLLHGFVKPNGTPSPASEFKRAMTYLEEYRITGRVLEGEEGDQG